MQSALSLLVVLALATACNKIVDEDGDGIDVEFDCDDSDIQVHPGAAEVCDGVDNDCDGVIDEDAGGGAAFFLDADGDGFGTMDEVIIACTAPEGYVYMAGDCDDSSDAIKPGADEVCDDLDNDCDGLADDEATDASAWYADWDGDGWGSDITMVMACDQPEAYLDTAGDCNDFDASANPDQPEVCDHIDNDCDGTADGPDAIGAVEWYQDNDGDAYGVTDTTVMACYEPDGFTDNTDDCDDGNWQVNPGMTEICNNGIDEDCSGDAPECGLGGTLLASEADLAITGPDSSTYFGGYKSLAMADVDGDGYDDLAIGAYGVDSPSTNAGAAYIFYGPVSDIELEAEDADTTISPPSATGSQYLGQTMASAGDVDGDGYEDLLVGARYTYDNYSTSSSYGAVYLIYGKSGGLSASETASSHPTFWGEASSDYLGSEVVGLGDINGDGYDDIGMAAYGQSGFASGDTNGGALYVFYGSSSSYSGDYGAEEADFIVHGSYYDYLGYYYNQNTWAGDFDGDGYADVAAGTGYSYSGSNTFEGYGGVYIFQGSSGGMSGDLVTNVDADAAFVGSANGDYFGRTLHAADLDADGYDDLIVGEYYGGTGGLVWVFQGSSTSWNDLYFAGTDDFASFAGANSSDYFGYAIDSGDYDGDGTADLMVGADGADPNGVSSAGEAYIFYGGLVSGDYETVDAGAIIQGETSSGYLTDYDSAASGDMNGDGYDDLMVGAYGEESYAGVVRVFLGGGM